MAIARCHGHTASNTEFVIKEALQSVQTYGTCPDGYVAYKPKAKEHQNTRGTSLGTYSTSTGNTAQPYREDCVLFV